MWQIINRNGFTLLEVLVAMAILSVIVVAIYTSFKGGTDSWTRGQSMSEITQNARVILEIMSRELATSILAVYSDLNDTTDDQDLVFVGDDVGNSDTLNFDAMLRSPDTTDKYKFGLVEIGYSHSGTTLSRRIDTTAIWDSLGVADTDPVGGGNTDDLAYEVKKLNFEYWDGSSFRTEWDTRLSGEGSITGADTTDDNTLPRAVKITITVQDSKNIIGEKEYSTQVELRGSTTF